MEHFSISIIIPVKPGGYVSAVASLRGIAYPYARFEIIIAEGTQPSVQRNAAVHAAQGELLYFLDDDSRVVPECLSIMDSHMRNPLVTAVGGPSLATGNDSPFQRSVSLALSSWLGAGAMRNRYREYGSVRTTDDRELILCNLCFRRSRFLELGGLDERLYPNEENELLERVRQAGDTLIHDPKLHVHRGQRTSLTALARQFFNYGRGRAEQTLISRQFHWVQFLPALVIAMALLLPFQDSVLKYLFPAVYTLCVVVFSLREAFRPGDSVRLMAIYPVIHFMYGIGLWWGVVRYPLRRQHPSRHNVVIKWIKSFADEHVPEQELSVTSEKPACRLGKPA